ncbi:hydroxymethylbilane synthase [Pseudofrankia asymbiotica]|uniref:Porphobilinogen deaminase n=1 Tax=Pseudofrankia asymbiotica TaxID=1834516 RepID=A0A1V2IB65_9ACTN|nr:hydroxymethylbilane synthase [Pseudofrankia asymbiotica]ONH30250.1 hydroxymethylbilane synthase [Pseudofrankia asymbiotica]
MTLASPDGTLAPGGPPARLRLGTRRSALALAQSGMVADELRARLGVEVELVHIVTEGDRNKAAINQLSGTGVFVSALRDALLAGEIDLAVHSLKDLPTVTPAGITLAAIPPREDVRDVLISPSGRRLAELGPGARIGTGAPRRAAQLLALGLGLEVVPIRGNVDTRIKKAIDGEVDAVVLAKAGLARLARLDAVTEILDPDVMLPSPGQGALAIECLTSAVAPTGVTTGCPVVPDGDVTGAGGSATPGSGVGAPLAGLLRFVLDDAPSSVAVRAERAFLAAIEAGCTAPVGALARVVPAAGSSWPAGGSGQPLRAGEVRLRAVVASPDGGTVLRRELIGPTADPEALGRRLADDLLSAGAHTLMGTR